MREVRAGGNGRTGRTGPPQGVRPKKERVETPIDRIKLEIARDLGLGEKVKQVGWGGLSAAETGRIGGHLTKRLKEAGIDRNHIRP